MTNSILPLSFLTFCIELYAEHTQAPSPEVYRLFVKTGLLDMLISDYDDLHGMSFEYPMQSPLYIFSLFVEEMAERSTHEKDGTENK
jgi:hypothetical protein